MRLKGSGPWRRRAIDFNDAYARNDRSVWKVRFRENLMNS